MTRGAWSAAFAAALQASWRVVIAVMLIAGIPMVALAVALVPIDDGRTSVRIVIVAFVLPASFFCHELSHAVTYARFACAAGITPEQFGIGRWTGGQIVRWPLTPGADATVAIAGPLAGVACCLSVVIPGGAFVVSFPFAMLFSIHLLSLRASSDDGEQARAFWKSGVTTCS
jgi:hypothetical protein